MQFPRRWLAPAVVAFSAAGFAGAQIATGNYGVKISELVHGPSQPTVGGLPVPTYVELVNVQIANPVVPQPMQLTGATLAISVNGSVGVFTFPAANAANVPSLLGGNVQPVPAAQPAVPPTEPPVCIVANGPLPTTMLPPGALVFVAPGLFAGPRAAFASVGVATEVCLQVPAFPPGPAPFLLPQPPVHDRMAIPPATAQLLCGATPSPFTQTNGWSNVNGRVSRWLYMDSNTDLDFDAIFPISPGVVNPEMAHVDGFTFGPPAPVGTPHPNPLLGAPLVFAGSATGTISAPPAVVTGVKFKSPVGASIPNDRLITAPVFDRTIGAAVTINGAFVSQGPSFGTLPGYLSGLAPAGITTTIVVPPTSTGGPPGVLTLPSGPSSLAFPPDAQPTPLNPTQFRIRRVFTDGIPDSGTSGTGDTSAAMDDTIPGSTGGGNVWCEVIVYDAAGNRYVGKAKNWPAPAACGITGAKLTLGTTGGGVGDGTVINHCHNPTATVYTLFSMTPAVSCGGPLFLGLCPDAVLNALLSPLLPLGTDPYHVMTDADGVFGWSVPAPTLAAFAGFTFEGVSVEYAGVSIVQISNVASVTF
jgi:hypothetical protein